MKKEILKGLSKGVEKVVEESNGSKCLWWAFYEEEMPKALKLKKENKNLSK